MRNNTPQFHLQKENYILNFFLTITIVIVYINIGIYMEGRKKKDENLTS